MIYEPRQFKLKNGLMVTFRTPEVRDAAKLLDQIISVAGSTDYLLSTPEDFDEFKRDITREESFILEWRENDIGCWIIACYQDQIIANCSLRFFKHIKDKHRSTIGIAINKEYQGMGIGSLLFDEMIKIAKLNPDIEQIELDVIAKNERAVHLYKSKGFVETGTIPHQLKLKDGTYLDGKTMVLFLGGE